jgi:hypothetical protein
MSGNLKILKASDDTLVWRYMDIGKFISMLNESTLAFARVDLLDDPFEGSYSRPSLQTRVAGLPGIDKTAYRNLSETFQKLRAYTFVSCWHMNDYESAAMWKLYLKTNEGVAIQTSFKNLVESLRNDVTSNTVAIGPVDYIDYDLDYMNDDNPLFAFFYKRKSFEYERELRAAITKIPLKGGGFINLADIAESYNENEFDLAYPLSNRVEKLPVDLELLIDLVYVTPTADDWLKEVIESLLEKYGLNKKVRRSDLRSDPIF